MSERQALEKIKENRADLEALAERDDLRMSTYARQLLQAADTGG